MASLTKVTKPTAEVIGAAEVAVEWTQVANADTYKIKVYPQQGDDSLYDVADAALEMTVARVAGTGVTEQLVKVNALEESQVLPDNNYKFSVTAFSGAGGYTAGTESDPSDALNVLEPQEADETELAVATETTNEFTGQAFAFAGATYGHVTYTRNADGTISQSLGGGDSVPGTPGALAGTQREKSRDAGNIAAAKTLASDLRYELTIGHKDDGVGGVSYIWHDGYGTPYMIAAANTEEDYAVIGQGSATQFTDRVADEVGAPKVSQSGTGKALTSEAATEDSDA